MTESVQTEKNIPKIYGEDIETLPQDLYIPPDALEIYLDSFEGPLDLLIYLIRKNNIDVLDIPMANLTLQYIKYVEKMKVIKLELAADYLLMSAMLIEIKSRMLLPRPTIEDDEEDPRAELVKKLIEYELMKDAAENLNQIPQVGKDIMVAQSYFERVTEIKYPDVSINELFEAWKNVLKRAKQFEQHQIGKSELSVREHMTIILRKLGDKDLLEFSSFFNYESEPIPKLVVYFLAILELTKEGLIKINQQSASSAIYLQLGEN
jgi:segregation and condensation protein A